MLEEQWSKGKFVCLGLDPELERLPEVFQTDAPRGPAMHFWVFCTDIVKATRDVVAAYKINLAFFEAHGVRGWEVLNEVVREIKRLAPDVPIIFDGKRGDIGNSNEAYARALAAANAVTVHPYLGGESLEPFLRDRNLGVFVLCKTSNPHSAEFQNLDVRDDAAPGRYMPLYQYVAHRVAHNWNANGNCGLVVGATYPNELATIRKTAGDDIPILIPGIGAQGGDLEKTVAAGKNSHGQGFLINASRSIIYASSGYHYAADARKEAFKLHDLINQHLNAKENA